MEKLTPPPGVKPEIIDMVNAPTADNKIYDYFELAEKIISMPIVPKVPTCFPDFDDVLDGGFQPGELAVLSGPTKNGKCFSLGTEIFMFDGSVKKVEDVVVGDVIMGADSNPRKVLSLGRGKEMMYRIKLRNGDSFTCNGSHILSLRKTGNVSHGKHSKGEIVNISVDEYLQKSRYAKHLLKLYKVPLNFKENNQLPLDPYFLGLWLGDGSKGSTLITKPDSEIREWLKQYALSLDMKLSIRNYIGKCPGYAVVSKSRSSSNLVTKLRELDLINNKHIPEIYKINSRENRLKILAGLIDSDGSVSTGSRIEFSNTNESLARDCMFIARSLGYSARMTPRVTLGFGKLCKSFRVMIGGDFSELPLQLKRKMPKMFIGKKELLNFSFTVEPVGVDDYYGFTISGDHLFVLADFTVVHNTTLAQTMTYFQASQNKTPSLWFTLEMSWQELTRKFMEMDWIYRDGGSPQHIPIFYPIDNRSLSLEWVEEQIKRAKEEHGVKMVFIDHLHFLIPMADSAKGNVSFLVGATVRAIKQIAVRNEITIVLIAHTKKLDVKETPDINSLRDSSFIAQESDFTIIVWRERLQPDKGANVLDYQEVYTDRTFVSVEANRRNGKTKRFALGMYRGTLRSWPEYVELSQQAFVDERVQNMGTEDDMLAMVRDQMSASPVQTSMLDDEDVALSKAVDLAIMKFGGRVVK